jgi:metallo-beta-lactamase class B
MMFSAVIFALAQLVADPPHVCDPCDEWNEPVAPFRVYGNSWFVGTAGLGSVLITSPEGHILIDGGLPQSAPLIAEHVAELGFRLEDIKLIVNSHTHYDHAGGIAALQRASHARVAASPASKEALERGGPTPADPQFGFGSKANDTTPVQNVQVVRDGETLNVGKLAITAHFTPGHTPGGTTWTWRSCEADRCLDLVYADSLNAVSAPGYRFSEDERAAVLERSIAVIEGLPCDLMLGAHPVFFDMQAKIAAIKADPAKNAFIDATACRTYAAGARERLKARLDEEGAAQARATR